MIFIRPGSAILSRTTSSCPADRKGPEAAGRLIVRHDVGAVRRERVAERLQPDRGRDGSLGIRSSAGLGDRSAEIGELVMEHPDGITPAKVAAELGIDGEGAGTYLGRLVDAGRLIKPRRGLYAPNAVPYL